MPYIHLLTTEAIGAAKEEAVLNALTAETSKITGKPAAVILAACQGGVSMRFAGTAGAAGPAAYISYKGIGVSEEQAPKLSSAFSAVLKMHLNVPQDRLYVVFENVKASMWGHNGSTF